MNIKFCDKCNNLVDDIDLISGISECLECGETYELPIDNKTIILIPKKSTKYILSNQECLNLSGLPTTNRIINKCKNCDFNIMDAITIGDEFTFICLKCKTIFK